MLSRYIQQTRSAAPLRSSTSFVYQTSRLQPAFRRHASLDAGENDSGHISSGPNEGVIFLNNIYPLSLQWLYFRLPWVTGDGVVSRLTQLALKTKPSQFLEEATNYGEATAPDGSKPSASVLEVLPRIKEGGAFIKFSHGANASSEQVQNAVSTYLKEKRISATLLPWRRIDSGLVKGKPWVEDLYRLPSQRLRVEFLPTSPGGEAAELSQEDLYSFFRPYGKLADIISQPTDSKVLPKYAFVDFGHTRQAVMAKNCLHGLIVSKAQGGGKLGTVLRLSYERRQKTAWIWEWLSSHPRIVLPILAALVAGFTVTVFDPIRTASIKAHITGVFSFDNYRIFRWLKGRTNAFLTSVRWRSRTDSGAGMQAIWDDRKTSIDQIQTWLMETADTFIVVQGPRGSGKKELVLDQALKHRKNKLVIDCKPINEARGDAATISAAAVEVGYRPMFSWMNSISGLVDLAAQGTTGIKTGLSETLENQLIRIWANTSTALKQVALEGRKKDDKDGQMSDGEYLEAHPERRPVVIIDNFLYKSQDNSLIYDKLGEWAASLVSSNVAHVIFLTHDVSFSKSLAKALPDRVFRTIPLSDCSEEAAKRYVVNHLDFDAPQGDAEDGTKRLTPSEQRKDMAELDEVLPVLGGRLTDLEFLARRIKTGETPTKATREIVEQAASEIQKLFLAVSNDEKRTWTPQQAWQLVKLLANSDSLRYNEILLSDVYKTGGDTALTALEQSELITIQSHNGRPYSVKAGRPVFSAAFKRLVDDAVLASKLDLAVLAESIKVETQTIDKCEQELHLLGELPKQPAELTGRIQWLLKKIQASQTKVEGLEKESAKLKNILTTTY